MTDTPRQDWVLDRSKIPVVDPPDDTRTVAELIFHTKDEDDEFWNALLDMNATRLRRRLEMGERAEKTYEISNRPNSAKLGPLFCAGWDMCLTHIRGDDT